MARRGSSPGSERCSPPLDFDSPKERSNGASADESDALDVERPEPGWSVQAFHKNEAAGEAGMWSIANERGTRLQGWQEDMEGLFDFAELPIVCPGCEQEMRLGGTTRQEQAHCSNPAVLAALARGVAVEACQLLRCQYRSTKDCFFALDVLAKLAQEEEWTLCSTNNQGGEYLGCLKFYLNRQFCRLVEQGKVVQCFDLHGVAQWAVFATGLLTRGTEEALFGVLQRGSSVPSGYAQWRLHSFVALRALQDPEQPWNILEAMVSPPEPASLCDDPMELLFVGSTAPDALQLHPQLWDDLEAHRASFPASLLEPGVTAQGRKQVAIAAVQRALQAVAHNPFAASPVAHANGSVQLLLPLKLEAESSRAHLALLVEASKSRRGARMYRATRVLSLVQAYMQARVLMPVQQPWLAPAPQPLAGKPAPSAAQRGTSSDSGLPSSPALQEAFETRLTSATNRSSAASLNGSEQRFTFDVASEGHDVSGAGYGVPSRAPAPDSLHSAAALAPNGMNGAAASSQPGPSSTGTGHRPAVRTMSATSLLRQGSGPTAYSPPHSFPEGYSTSSSYSDGSSSDKGLPTSIPGTLASGGGSGSYVIQEPSRLLAESPRLRHSSSLPANLSPGIRRGSYGDLYRESGLGGLPFVGEQQHSGSRANGKGQNAAGEEGRMLSRGLSRFDSLPPLILDEPHMPVEVLQLSPIPNGNLESGKPPLSGNLGGYSWGTSSGSVSNALLASSSDGSYGGGGLTSSEYTVRGLGGPGLGSGGSLDSPHGYRTEPGSSLWARELNRELSRDLGHASLAELEYGNPASRRPPEEEYVEFTPVDDLCPKLNISQLPPRFVMDFLAGDRPAGEAAAEQHAEQCFSSYGVVARTLVRENKNHPGKWFAIIEFAYWTDDVVRLRLVAGEQIRFLNFYAGEDVFIRRHKDKQKVVNRNQTVSLTGVPSGGLPCRPDWKYTGTDTRAGKPLYKGPCTVCGRESTVPFKPVVNGQPPRCRNCLPLTQGGLLPPGSQAMTAQQLASAIPSSMAAGGLQPNQQGSLYLDSGLGMGPLLGAYRLHHLHD